MPAGHPAFAKASADTVKVLRAQYLQYKGTNMLLDRSPARKHDTRPPLRSAFGQPFATGLIYREWLIRAFLLRSSSFEGQEDGPSSVRRSLGEDGSRVHRKVSKASVHPFRRKRDQKGKPSFLALVSKILGTQYLRALPYRGSQQRICFINIRGEWRYRLPPKA